MSGAQTSTFGNVLFNAPAAYQAAQQYQNNQLLMQEKQQTLTDHDVVMTSQGFAPLLGMSEDDAAKAYPQYRQGLQQVGYARYAPETYPGHAATQALVQRALPLLDQYKVGWITDPKADEVYNRAFGGGTGTGSGATATGGGGAATGAAVPATSGTVEPDALARAQAVRDGLIKRGLDVDTATGFAANALHESGANPNAGAGDAGASHGTFQWNADRYNRYIAINGHPPDNAPLDEQLDFVIHELGTTEGAARDRIAAAQGPSGKAAAISQYYLRPKDVQPEMARRSATATQLATQWGGAGTSTAAPVITGDSLASSDGLGGTGVVGDSPAKVLARVQAESRAGKYDGKPVVLSTGASNDFGTDLGSVEQQIREAQGGNAGKITVLGVGPSIEAKAPGTNAKLQALAKAYGAQFVPLPADQMSPDGVHPTAQGYATLKAAVAPSQGAPGGGGAGGRYQLAGQPVAGPGGSGGQPQPQAQVPQPSYVDRETGLPVIGTQPGTPQAAPQPQAQVPQPPANRVMPGSADGPPAPTPPPAQQPPPSARSNLPRAADVPTGVNSPQYQQAQQMAREALRIKAMPGYALSPKLQAAAAYYDEQSKSLAQADSVVNTQEGQVHTLTGKIDNPAQPNANYVWSPEQRAYIDTTGTHPPVTPPSPRFSPPTVDPSTGKPAVAVEGGQGGTRYLPIPDRPATATFDLQKEQHKRDTDELPKYNEQNQQAAANQIRIQQMRELVDQISTGAGGAERANWANIAETMGWTELSKRLVGMGGAAAAQEFAKYGLATAGAQERGDLGARGSLGAITLYKSANPGLELQPDANKKMLTAQLIAAQANRDYTQGAMDYVNRNGDAFVIHGANYTPLSHFDAEWAAQRSPQIYAAAMSAINGDPWQKWTKALNMKSADDVARVVEIVRRADPTSTVMWKNGEPHVVGTSQ